MRHFLSCLVLILVGCLSRDLIAFPQQQPEKEVRLIRGLDGGDYEPYAPQVIEEVQKALQSQGLYSGEVNGVLNEATMEAISRFQEQNGLQVCGVPTPSTRRVLLDNDN